MYVIIILAKLSIGGMMLGDFVFSISVTMPIFLVISLGALARKLGFIDENFVSKANMLIYWVALPIKLFFDTKSINIKEVLDIKFLSFIVLGISICFFISLSVSKFFIKNKSKRGTFIQGCFRTNFVYMGFSIMENIIGNIGAKAPISLAIVIPTFNIFSILSFSIFGDKKEENILKSIIVKLIKNPLNIAIFSGILFSLIGIKIPLALHKTAGYMASMVTPLAMITIGASLKLEKDSTDFAYSLLASFLKLVVNPIILLSIAYFIGYRGEDLLLLYTLFGLSTALLTFTLAGNLGGNQKLAANIILFTTTLSSISITLFVFTFKIMGII